MWGQIIHTILLDFAPVKTMVAPMHVRTMATDVSEPVREIVQLLAVHDVL